MNTDIDISNDDTLRKIITHARARIKARVGTKDRAHYKEDSDDISEEGIAAEVVALKMFTRTKRTSNPHYQSGAIPLMMVEIMEEILSVNQSASIKIWR